MSESEIIPVILCGGEGRRLWPLSHDSKPKPFLHLTGGKHNLFQETILRCRSAGITSRPIIVTAVDHEALVVESLQAINVAADIVLEPVRRNTAAAVFAGTLCAAARDSFATVLVLAADHEIHDAGGFGAAVRHAEQTARDHLAIFGVKPTHAASNLGYIKPGVALSDEVFRVQQFIEKPGSDVARQLIAEGCRWNSGNLLASADVIKAEAVAHASEAWRTVASSFEKAQLSGSGARHLDEAEFGQAASISFDVAVLEKSRRVAVMPVDYAWRDLGTLDSLVMRRPQLEIVGR